METLHPIKQTITAIDIDTIPDVQGGYAVGRNGVTRIEACSKPGLHCDIPYVRVWQGDVALAEFCQHNIVGVYFEKVAAVEETEAERCKRLALPNIVDGECTTCGFGESSCICIPF